jgi:hypothetical protein
MEKRICKRRGCGREFFPKETNTYQIYCCRDCAPYGNWYLQEIKPQKKREQEDEEFLKENESFLM